IEGKTPKQIEKIKICDPACGSGSFLIGAYQYLLDYHLKYYTENPPRKKKDNPLTPEGNLTTAEKKRILLNNIYGVDIDTQAVEVTKLNLLLKAMEGETQASIGHTLSMFHERVLPNLKDNIKCGNSLIDTDYYDGQIDFGDERKINPFNWKRAFPEVFNIKKPDSKEELSWHNIQILAQADEAKQKAKVLIQKYSNKLSEPTVEYGISGFDVVIGNPPYARIQSLQNSQPEAIEYYRNRYRGASKGNFDIYVLFLEKGYQLLNQNGVLGFIQPHKFFQSDFAKNIRNYFATEKALKQIVHFGAKQVFADATTYTCLLFLDKQQNKHFNFLQIKGNPEEAILSTFNGEKATIENYSVKQPAENTKWHFSHPKKQQIIDKLNLQSQKLGDVVRKIFVGLQTSADKIYVLEKRDYYKGVFKCYSRSLEQEVEIEEGMVKPFLMGKDVKRYQVPEPKNVVIFPYQLSDNRAVLMSQDYIKEQFPLGWNYLLENKKDLQGREKGRMKGKKFYAYIYPKNLTEFTTVKVMVPYISNEPSLTYDSKGTMYHTTKVYSFCFTDNKNEKYYLGLLNSKILWFFLSNTGYVLRGGYYAFATEYLKPFPIPDLDISNQEEKDKHDQIVKLVDNLLKLNKQLQTTKLETQRNQLQRAIDHSERKIDELVYGLYGLNGEDIAIIENF
ncbi:MAG: N-6 DNA methylase, partial [Nitrosopumilus sp.]